MDQLGEYTSRENIGHGKTHRTAVLTSPVPNTSVQDSEIQQLLQQEIAPRIFRRGPQLALFFSFFAGVRLCRAAALPAGSSAAITTPPAATFFMRSSPYPGCSGCTGGLTVADALTSTTSHELCEAVTDPVARPGMVRTTTTAR